MSLVKGEFGMQADPWRVLSATKIAIWNLASHFTVKRKDANILNICPDLIPSTSRFEISRPTSPTLKRKTLVASSSSVKLIRFSRTRTSTRTRTHAGTHIHQGDKRRGRNYDRWPNRESAGVKCVGDHVYVCVCVCVKSQNNGPSD